MSVDLFTGGFETRSNSVLKCGDDKQPERIRYLPGIFLK
jgi:hypothetical protein